MHIRIGNDTFNTDHIVFVSLIGSKICIDVAANAGEEGWYRTYMLSEEDAADFARWWMDSMAQQPWKENK